MKLTIGVVIVALVTCNILASPIIEYNFNDTGTSTLSTGTDTAVMVLKDSAGTWSDLHSASGLGVSGESGDRAFDNTASTGMGSAGIGGRGDDYVGDDSAIDGLMSFTIQGWFKTDGVVIGGNCRVIENFYSNKGFYIQASSGQLYLSVDSGAAGSGSSSDYNQINTWTFFAVTYDGTQSASNLNFYVGYEGSQVQLVSTQTLDMGQVDDDVAALAIGNSRYSAAAYSRPFDGYLDNMRIFGSKTDASGVLDQQSLEVIRATDVPEPATMLVFSTGLLWVVMRKKTN